MSTRGTSPIQVGISFGGSKLAVAAVDVRAAAIAARGERVEWRSDPRLDADRPAASLFELAASEAADALARAGVRPQEVTGVGIAWPGPGEYSRGLLQATFLPGFTVAQDAPRLFTDAWRAHAGTAASGVQLACRLDARARAIGETRIESGAFAGEEQSGVVLNIATGIAGAIVTSGRVVQGLPGLGETYGQWGRFLLFDPVTEQWRWAGTPDGTMPPFDPRREVRFTDWCGGPGLVARLSADMAATGGAVVSSRRDIVAEREVLIAIGRAAYDGETGARAFVAHVGRDVGGAMVRLRATLGADLSGGRVVLAGGVGENFGSPPPSVPDLFLASLNEVLAPVSMTAVRSRAGLDAELVGAVPGLPLTQAVA